MTATARDTGPEPTARPPRSMLAGVDRDPQVASTIENPAVKVGIVLPSAVCFLYALLTGSIVNLELTISIAVTALLLAVVAVVRPWSRIGERGEEAWQLLSGTVGVGLAAPFLAVAIDVDIQHFTLVFALILVLGAYTYPKRFRMPLSVWTLVVWLVTLWWGGVDDPATLSLHLGGGLVLLATCVRTADALAGMVAVEAANRAASERHAQLLASVLRTNSLEPAAILRAVVTGLVDAGFDAVAIRELDEESGLLRLVDGHRAPQTVILENLPIDQAHLTREAMGRGKPVVVDDYDRSPAVLNRGHGLRGTVVVPVRGDGHTVAVVTGASTGGPLDAAQVEAARLLAEQAGLALERARAFEADRETVEELRMLEVRTQDFVSTVSHELRTPLTVVQGLGQTLLRRWDDLDELRRRDLLNRIDANADRLAVMVRSLLDTSAFERGELTVEWRQVDLRSLVEAVVHRLETITLGYPVEVEVPEGVMVDADPALVDHVLENLLLNVTKHTPPGTTTRVVARSGDGQVEIDVVDDGPGIPPEDLPHVLDRFYRGGTLTTRPAGGLGLGLALARQIVQAHGSELAVDSEVDRGTTFRFTLPLAGVVSAPPPPARQP